jgi:NADPH:quinone reductase-like Zn-dependent oxidoreductase
VVQPVWLAGLHSFDAAFQTNTKPVMSRIVEFASFGAPEVLKFKEVSDLRPAAGEVRIRVKAIGLNRAESMYRVKQEEAAARSRRSAGDCHGRGRFRAGGDETDGREGCTRRLRPCRGPNFPKLISALALQGILYIYGALSENVTPLPVLEMIAKMATIKGHNIWLASGNPDKLKTAVAFIRRGFDEGKLKPVIDRIFRFDEIVEAHRYLEANHQFGKIVATL